MSDDRKKIIIFSGTTEGRRLSEALIAAGIAHSVCVATEYGEELQPKDELVCIEEGRKTAGEMCSLFAEGTLLVADATHPFATEVTANIQEAAKRCGVRYIRVLREAGETPENAAGADYFGSAAECAEAAEKTEGRIFFTTGSKELAAMCEKISDLSRVYVRVLPSVNAIEACLDAGIKQDHIIGMQGPFTKDMNLALIKQYGISCMVTKESGITGGFDEKISACREAGIKALVIKRPAEEKGIDVEAAAGLIRYFAKDCSLPASVPQIDFELTGLGMGGGNYLIPEGEKAIKHADVIFGAERLIAPFAGRENYAAYRAEEVFKKTAELVAGGKKIKNVAVLFSGDTGFCSGASAFSAAAGRLEHIYRDCFKPVIKIIPGISSVSCLSAKCAIPYSDAQIISLHGKCDDHALKEAAKRIAASEKSFVIFSGGDDVGRLASLLMSMGIKAEMILGSNLGYPDEAIRKPNLSLASEISGKGLYTAVICNETLQRRRLIPYLEDEDFERDKVPMTKALIRHEVIRELELKEGDVLYDVGAGSGSVSIEAAGLSASLKVYGFEKKPEACELFRKNVQKHKCRNIVLTKGEAPESFEGIEPPDAVFIGGSAGRFKDILKAVIQMKKPVRVVMSAVSLEAVSEMVALKCESMVHDLKIRQIGCSNAAELGDYHIMKAENNVFIASFKVGEAE